MAALKTRSFSIPAGTVINNRATPAPITVRVQYSPSETSSGAAQKTALRQAQAELARRFHITAPLSHIQRATKARHTETAPGRVRGGRIPARLKVAGGFADKGAKNGIHIYRKGSEKSPGGTVTFDQADAMVRAAFAAHPGNVVAVAVYGWPADWLQNDSPRRYKRSSPIGTYKKGDVIPKSRQWGSVPGMDGGVAVWEQYYASPVQFSDQTLIDPARMSRVDVLVREAGK